MSDTKPTPDDVPRLIASLASKDGMERQSARNELVSLGSASVSALVNALNDKTKVVRKEAAKASW